jgi:hypothetical protein
MSEIMKHLIGRGRAMSCMFAGSFRVQHSLISCNGLSVITTHIIAPMFAKAVEMTATAARQAMIMATMPSAIASDVFSITAGIGAGTSSTMIPSLNHCVAYCP